MRKQYPTGICRKMAAGIVSTGLLSLRHEMIQKEL